LAEQNKTLAAGDGAKKNGTGKTFASAAQKHEWQKAVRLEMVSTKVGTTSKLQNSNSWQYLAAAHNIYHHNKHALASDSNKKRRRWKKKNGNEENGNGRVARPSDPPRKT
jgi:hypothetical protein